MKSITRVLNSVERSFFLFGPRGTGKSTWLKARFPDSPYIDLLHAGSYLELSRHPERLEALINGQDIRFPIIVDEIQRIPELLNEVHRLMEDKKWIFALCGSSARKLKRGGANLLAGRALPLYMEGFSFTEIPHLYDTRFAVEWGTLPLVAQSPSDAADVLSAYVNMYIKESH